MPPFFAKLRNLAANNTHDAIFVHASVPLLNNSKIVKLNAADIKGSVPCLDSLSSVVF
jgi:hypothetical protein